MKRYLRLYALLAIAIIGGLVLYTQWREIPQNPPVDMVAINEIIQVTQRDWPNLPAEAPLDFAYPVAVIDLQGQLCWTTGTGAATSLAQAVRQRDAILDIVVEGQVVGKAAIKTFSDQTHLPSQISNQKLWFLAVLALCGLSLLFLWGLHRSVVQPFQRLQQFAHKISTGNLDEPLPMDRGNMFGAFTQSFDLMRASLQQARKQQAAAERAKKELIASLSHDIKTPVTSIKLITELLLAGNPPPNIGDKLRNIDGQIAHIIKLVNDMLRSSIEELEEIKVEVATYSSEVLANILREADSKGKVSMLAFPPCLISIDLLRMQQVVGNVISNSLKYADTPISVKSWIENDYLLIEIEDQGPGVPGDTIELLCTQFYRGEQAKHSQKEGEGLGLYISKLLMDKMNGGIELYNHTDGFGVRLSIKLAR